MSDSLIEEPAVILVVDDDWMNRELLQTHLQMAGYEVVTANSGQRGLEATQVRPPDLVLLDVRMSGLSGYEVCARLKAQESTRYVPVIIVTGLDSDGDYQEAIAAGADDFLPKPFNSIIMLARIRSLLRIKRLHMLLAQRENSLRTILQRYVDGETAEMIVADLSQ